MILSLVRRLIAWWRDSSAAIEHRAVAIGAGMSVNFAFAVMNLLTGIIGWSLWPLSLGIFYTMLAAVRGTAIAGGINDDEWTRRELGRMAGAQLVIMDVVLAVMMSLILEHQGGFRYPGILVYAMAAYTLFQTVYSVRGLVLENRSRDTAGRIQRTINLTAALVSILATEDALMATFGSQGTEEFRIIISQVTCIVVFCLAVTLALVLIWQCRRSAPYTRKENESNQKIH